MIDDTPDTKKVSRKKVDARDKLARLIGQLSDEVSEVKRKRRKSNTDDITVSTVYGACLAAIIFWSIAAIDCSVADWGFFRTCWFVAGISVLSAALVFVMLFILVQASLKAKTPDEAEEVDDPDEEPADRSMQLGGTPEQIAAAAQEMLPAGKNQSMEPETGKDGTV